MLTCITCAKQTDEIGEKGGGRGNPNTKESVRSLTSQMKDMALRFSGGYKQCEPCTSPTAFRKEYKSYPDIVTASDGIPYPSIQTGSPSSTPAWDFSSTCHNQHRGSHSRYALGGEEPICSQSDVLLNDEPREWMAEVEPGVHITFISLPHGGNDLRRIRFSREIFDKWQAQRWWGENYDRITELYNVQRFNRQASSTSVSGDEQRDSYTRTGSSRENPLTNPSFNKDWTSRHYHKPSGSFSGTQSHNAGWHAYGNGGGPRAETDYVDASRTTTSSRDEEASISNSNASDIEAEWVEQDEPGVFITLRQLTDGTKELRRVRFSREKFGEVRAKLWWERNRERIQAQYL